MSEMERAKDCLSFPRCHVLPTGVLVRSILLSYTDWSRRNLKSPLRCKMVYRRFVCFIRHA
jgi:hypothetical protein